MPSLVRALLALPLLAPFLVSDPGGERADGHAAAPTFRLLVTGPTAGALEPCGCAGGMKGGLARRPAVLELAASEVPGTVVLDCGDLVAPPRDLPALPSAAGVEELVFDLVAQALAQMDYGATALGDRDLVLPPRSATRGTGTALFADLLYRGPPVLTNVHVVDGDAVARPAARIDAAGRSVLVLGVIDEPGPRWDRAYRHEPPLTALQRELARPENTRRDLVVLVFHGTDEARLRALVRAVDGIDLVLDADGALEPDDAASVRREGRTLLVRPGERGRYVLDLTLVRDERDGVTLTALEALSVEESWPEVEALADLVNQYRERTRTASPPLSQSYAGLVLPPDGALYAGSGSCQPCHPRDHAIWSATRHAHALETLEAKGAQHAPDCVRCHVVGFGLVSGYEDPRLAAAGLANADADRSGVGCEECHGPGLRHVFAPRRHRMVTHPRTAPRSCTRCHDTENSPGFLIDEEGYWKKIAHGGE